ncbi:MAG: hypothetical protein ACOYPS_04045, partial [Phycisphaerales bacterium]
QRCGTNRPARPARADVAGAAPGVSEEKLERRPTSLHHRAARDFFGAWENGDATADVNQDGSIDLGEAFVARSGAHQP